MKVDGILCLAQLASQNALNIASSITENKEQKVLPLLTHSMDPTENANSLSQMIFASTNFGDDCGRQTLVLLNFELCRLRFKSAPLGKKEKFLELTSFCLAASASAAFFAASSYIRVRLDSVVEAVHTFLISEAASFLAFFTADFAAGSPSTIISTSSSMVARSA